MIYDGECTFCRRKVERFLWLARGKVIAESFRESGVIERYGLSRERCEQAMQLVSEDGAIFEGAEAVARILRHHPLLRWPAELYWMPGFRQAADFAYRWVSRNRRWFH